MKIGIRATGVNGKHQRCDSYLTSTSFLILLYAFIMTYLLPLLLKLLIASSSSIQVGTSIPGNQFILIEYYASTNGLSFLIFLVLSKFTYKNITIELSSLTTFTPLSLSACLCLFTSGCGLNYSLYLIQIIFFYIVIRKI